MGSLPVKTEFPLGFFTKLKRCCTQPEKEKTIISKRLEGKTILFLEEQFRKLQA